MPLNRIVCPECGAGLKSAAGFTPGRTVTCPKCETPFTVEDPGEPEPAPVRKPARAAAIPDDEDDRPRKKRQRDDEDDDRPRKKKKKKAEGGSYGTSPLRFVILGILLAVLGVLGFMLYLKKQQERENSSLRWRGGEVVEDVTMPLPHHLTTPGYATQFRNLLQAALAQ